MAEKIRPNQLEKKMGSPKALGAARWTLGLYKILFYFKALLSWESIIF